MSSRPQATWANISRFFGLTIVILLLAAFMASFILNRTLNTTVTLGFLGVASFLLGAPSGLSLVLKRNGESSK